MGAASGATANGGAIVLPKRGTFYKQSKLRKKLIEREFLLDSSSLTHYNIGASKAKSRNEANTWQRVQAVDHRKFGKHALTLTTNGGLFHYAFVDEKARDEWLAAFDHVI